MKSKIAIVMPKKWAEKMFVDDDLNMMRQTVDIDRMELFETMDEPGLCRAAAGMDGVITSWETPAFTKAVLDQAPNLKIIAHAGGSVKPIVTDAVWEREIVVTSAAAAISIGVAETSLAFILMAGKRMPWLARVVADGGWQDQKIMSEITEMFRATIGIIGAGHVGRHLIRLLKGFEAEILLCDPYCSEEKANELGAEKVSLEELLKQSDFISLNAPLTDETRGMLGKKQLELIKDGAVLLNTARGAIFNEKELIEELKKGRFVACLDVTDPEPPAADNPLRTLDNVFLTPHIAGVVTNNFVRMGRMAVDEIVNYFSDKPNTYPISKEMLATIG